MAIKQVISQIKQKVDNGNGSFSFVPYKIGPELKYVTSLDNSNNNNLEEMLLLGTDRVIESQIDNNDNEIEVIQYKKENDNNKYYILTKTNYGHAQSDIQVINSMLYLNTVMEANGASAYQTGDIDFIYTDNSLYISPDVSIGKLNLKQKDGENEINIADKDIIQLYVTDGNIRKKIIREKITNYL